MEDRPVPPPGRATDNPPLLPAPHPESQDKDTYVVKVPRDQVYRFPPPENARIVEQHTLNAPQQNKSKCFSGSLWWIIATIILIIAILIASIMLVRATLYSIKSPKFTITQMTAKNMNQILRYNPKTSSHPPVYEISLQAENPNTRLSTSYHGPGKASLVFEHYKIGQGGLPSTVIREEPDGPAKMLVTLSGKGIPLSPALKLSIIKKAEKTMSLNLEVTMEVKSWLRNGMKDLTITCDFGVTKSLMNHTKISSQDCDAQF